MRLIPRAFAMVLGPCPHLAHPLNRDRQLPTLVDALGLGGLDTRLFGAISAICGLH